ncbi:MAG: metallophosphoesterase [Ketobacter sp.]|nr:metallophosphoesterase [Ketobacter sp.]
MSRVLVVGDPHEPVCHPGYRAFCRGLGKKFKTTKTVIIGDICDHHGISFHAANPMCPGPDDEYLLTKQKMKQWHKDFPNAIITIGNHDARVVRLAESVNIPAKYLRDYNEVWKTPTWKWVGDVKIDDVYYFHGTGRGGLHPAFNAMKDNLMSTVMGHCHSVAGVQWKANPNKRVFGMDTGCGIDVDAWQFAYGKHMARRPILSAAVVLNGDPQHFIMPCGHGERYHKSRFV